MKSLLIGLCLLSSVVASDFANGFEPRALLEQTAKSEANLRSSVITDQSWVPYPAYTDREAWDQFTGDSKRELIRQGEKYLNFPFLPFLDFLFLLLL